MVQKLLLFFMFPILCFGQTKVHYNIFYTDNIQSNGLKIEISCQSDKASDSTYFHYANEVWGENNLTNCLKFIAEENPQYRFKIVADSSRVVVYHPKSKNIQFTYHIKQDHAGDKPEVTNRPIVQQTYFHILGQSLFTVPEQIFKVKNDVPRIDTTIDWVGFPDDFKIHNTFATNKKSQRIKGKLNSEFYHSLFVGGDYRIYNFSYANKPVYFAIRGEWLNTYQDERIFNALKKVISSQRTFWKDNNMDYFTVIMSPTVTQKDSIYKGQSITGSAVKNGFMIQSTNNPFNNFSTINYIFNHEMMHDWIGGKIKTKEEELNYWFSEGFTDYYTFKNRLRSNDMTFNEWLSEFNDQVIKAHWNNPERNKPNYIIKDDFWKSRNIEKIPYRRGAIFAFWLDNKILRKTNYSKSLDDLMRELLVMCTKENKLFSDELFLDLAKQYLDEDITYFFQKHIISGVDFNFKKEDFIDGFEIDSSGSFPKLIATDPSKIKYIAK